jgi:hypothetical protein
MEGNYELEYIFGGGCYNNYIDDIYDVFPFKDYNYEVDGDGLNNDFMLDLLKIDFSNTNYTKHEGNSEDILDKLNKIECSYNTMLRDNIASAPTISK